MTAFDSPRPAPELTPKQRALIAALLSQPTQLAAAKVAGISEKTMYRWLAERHVQAAYQEASQRQFDATLSTLRQAAKAALITLLRNMQANADVPPSTQVRAAQIVLEQAIQLHKVAELEARLNALEEQFGIKR